MTAVILFNVFILILSINFLINWILDSINSKHFNDKIPNELKDVYDEEAYLKSQAYKKENSKFSSITTALSFILTISFFYLEGFAYVDQFARSMSDQKIIVTLVFFGTIILASDFLTLPLSYYKTFVIEEKFGFNKTTQKLFLFDKLKGWLLMIVIGGSVLALITWFYQVTASNFWIYTWLFVAIFSIFMTLFYSSLIVPLFNKQTPLEQGELREKLETFAQKVGFNLTNIFVIDGSKRSTKANAYFTGFGPKKRIVLYDTLINDLETDEIVAVLAHEVGHYKKNHVVYNMIISVLLTGFTLYILSLFIGNTLLSQALSVSEPSFHIGLIAFGILYSPISEITGLLMNILSRKFEYEADDYAKEQFDGKALITSLKKLSKNSLSNLTPHKSYVFLHYSHPTLLQRVQNIAN